MKVAVLTPVYDSRAHVAHVRAVNALRAALGQRGDESAWMTAGHSANLPRLRNWLAAEALAWGADVLFWLDSDVGFPLVNGASDPSGALKLVDSPHPLIAAAVQKRPLAYDEPPKLAFEPLSMNPDTEKGEFGILSDGMAIVGKAATACMKTDASLFRQLAEAGIALRMTSKDTRENSPLAWKHYRNYFWYEPVPRGVDPETGEELFCDDGEDYYFCRQLAKLGVRILIDPTVRLVHYEGGTALSYSFWEAYGADIAAAIEPCVPSENETGSSRAEELAEEG